MAELKQDREDSSINIFSAMRSLYRYLKLTDLCAPDFLFEMEIKLLRSRIIKLTEEELDRLVLSWLSFYNKQKLQDELEDIELDKDLDRFFQSLN